MNCTHNNGMIIRYVDSATNECIHEQETAIASVILQSVTYCNYIVIDNVKYIVIETNYIVSKDDIDKNVYEIWVSKVLENM